jgi:biotin synthase-related radical SAM superfamily protein
MLLKTQFNTTQVEITMAEFYSKPIFIKSELKSTTPVSVQNFRTNFNFWSVANAFIQSNPQHTALYEMSQRVLENVKSYFEEYLSVNFYDDLNV